MSQCDNDFVWVFISTEMCEGIGTFKLESTCSLREGESPVHLTRYSFVFLHNLPMVEWIGGYRNVLKSCSICRC